MACQLKEIEVELEKEYKEFINTDKGKEWQKRWQKNLGSDNAGDFGDFYPEMLQWV